MKATTRAQTGREERRSWTQEQKREHGEAWRRCGLSRLACCRQEGLGYGTFGRWVAWEGSGRRKGFAQVEVAEEPCLSGMEFIAPNGWRVRVIMTLAEVMEVVGRC